MALPVDYMTLPFPICCPCSSLGVQVATMRITGMTCASCSNALEKALGALGGVQSANVSLSLEQAEVTFDPSLATEVCIPTRRPFCPGCCRQQACGTSCGILA